MRRVIPAVFVACAAALIAAACGSAGPTPSPTPTPGGGGSAGGNGGQQPPTVVNTAPQIKSITFADTRVEAGTPVTLTAVVEDADTPIANLEFRWSAETGTFSGNTAVVTWTPGSDAKTPADYVVTLTVAESFTSGSITLENKATSTATAHVNNSPKELADLSVRFLTDFATSSVSPTKCVSEFSESCRGKKDEFNDIDDNRHDFLITGSTIRHTGLSIASSRTTATVHTFCSFTSKVITTQPRDESCQNGACPLNSVGTATGDCWTTNVYESGRWFLCESHFTGQGPLSPMMRAFFGKRRLELP
jgi:hypothetical protein